MRENITPEYAIPKEAPNKPPRISRQDVKICEYLKDVGDHYS